MALYPNFPNNLIYTHHTSPTSMGSALVTVRGDNGGSLDCCDSEREVRRNHICTYSRMRFVNAMKTNALTVADSMDSKLAM